MHAAGDSLFILILILIVRTIHVPLAVQKMNRRLRQLMRSELSDTAAPPGEQTHIDGCDWLRSVVPTTIKVKVREATHVVRYNANVVLYTGLL